MTGPLRYMLTAREAVNLCRDLRPRVTIPVHYEGWKHFREGRGAIERAFAVALLLAPRREQRRLAEPGRARDERQAPLAPLAQTGEEPLARDDLGRHDGRVELREEQDRRIGATTGVLGSRDHGDGVVLGPR